MHYNETVDFVNDLQLGDILASRCLMLTQQKPFYMNIYDKPDRWGTGRTIKSDYWIVLDKKPSRPGRAEWLYVISGPGVEPAMLGWIQDLNSLCKVSDKPNIACRARCTKAACSQG